MNLQDATVVEGSQFEHFLILQDPEGEQKILLDSKSYRLGRSLENEIVLRSQSVSREHATLTGISLPPPLFQVFRLNDGASEQGKSTNGVLINGKIRNSWVLMQGDQIVFSSNSSAIYQISPEPPYANGKIGFFLESLHNLATNSMKSGKYTDTENYLNQILILNQQLYGESNPNIANCLIDLAALKYSQNFFDKAESLFLQAIALRQKSLGAEHLDVAIAMLDLAAIYNKQALYEKAELMFLQAVAIKQKTLGENHPEIAANLVDLGAIYYSQKRYQEAKSLYERSLKIYKQSFIAGHPNIVSVQKKLMNLNKKLRPKWLSWNVFIPASFVLLSGVVAYTFLSPKTDISCLKVLTDSKVELISGDECRQITK